MKTRKVMLATGLVGTGILACALVWFLRKQPINGQWGKPREGIQALLYSTHDCVRVGEEFELRVKLRNTSDTTVLFPAFPYLTIHIEHNGKPLADSIGNIQLQEDKMRLFPRQIVDFHLEYYKKTHEKPGRYTYSGSLGRLELEPVTVRVKSR